MTQTVFWSVRVLPFGGTSRFFWRSPCPLSPASPASAPTLTCGVCDEPLTGLAGLGGVARLTRFLGLPARLAKAVRLRRGGSDGQRLLALIYAACAGGGHLHAVDALGADHVARRACGLQAVAYSGQLGADLQRLHEAALEGLRQGARLVSRRLVPLGGRSGGGPCRCAETARGSRGGPVVRERRARLPRLATVLAALGVRGGDGGQRPAAGGRHGHAGGLAGETGLGCGALADRGAAGGAAGRQRVLLRGTGKLLPAAGRGCFRERDRSAPKGPASAPGGREGVAGGRGGAPGRGRPGAGARGGVPAGPGAGGAGARGAPARRRRGAAAAGTGMHGDSGEPRPAAAGGVGAAAPRPAGAVAGLGPAASAVPHARGTSGFLMILPKVIASNPPIEPLVCGAFSCNCLGKHQ